MTALRVAELESLFTANTKDIARAEKEIQAVGKRVEGKKVTQKIEGDEKGALSSFDRVETAAKKLVSKDTALTINANIERFETGVDRAQKRLDYLKSIEATVDVKADIARAEGNLQRIERQAAALKSARVEMVIDADGTPAENVINDLADRAGDAGKKGGRDAGEGLSDGLVGALASIPIAGAIAGIAYIAAKAVREGFENGLQIEVRQDRLQALTGLQEGDAARLARAAGEAYADNFGDSVEANMDAARLALQFNILDPAATTRDAQKVVEGLAGIASVLGEDVQPIAAAVATLLSTGVVKSADEAFDLIATGAREGVNRSGDLLDTLTEYPALFARLGLKGPEALGLISQGLKAGARNSDLAADALKEFQIRATDGSTTSAQGFKLIGLNAQEMTAKIAAGGDSAKQGLDQVLDGLRAIEDPVQRNAAAVALFGTQAEDLGSALFAMDLTTAVDQLDGVTGAAKTMFDTLSDNDASKIETAQRNIEVAAQGIQGALAAAFSKPIGDFATFVSENRGPVMQFLLDLANGALDFGESMVEGIADGTEAVGEFVSGPLADLAEGLGAFIGIFDHDAGNGLKDFAKDMRTFDDTANAAAKTMREKVGGALEEARDRLNKFADPVVALGFLNDASLRLAGAVEAVGVAADGANYSIAGIDVNALNATASGSLLEQQIYGMKAALEDQITAAEAAGESEDNLADRRDAGRKALEDQLTAMGFTQEQVGILIGLYDSIKPNVNTTLTADSRDAASKINDVIARLNAIPGNTNKYVNIITTYPNGKPLSDRQLANQFGFGYDGGVVEFMAQGGLRGLPNLVPMDRIAQVVSPNTFRVVGDRGDVAESYIPHDGSARSMAILLETMRRFGLLPMAEGGIIQSGADQLGARGGRASVEAHFHLPPGVGVPELVRAARADLNDLLRG